VEDGVPEAEIRRRLEARLPDRDLSPLPRGPLGWALPLLILLAGLGILVIALRRVTAPADEATLDPEVEAKLLRELEE
jgi:cytochrome c-type biogenesis protein CcmH/NrfF